MNNTNNGLYSVNEVLEKGTIFKELYKPYKNYVYKLKLSEDTLLSSYILAMHDLKLYLDIHPDDEDIKKLYEAYKAKVEEIQNDPRTSFKVGRYHV